MSTTRGASLGNEPCWRRFQRGFAKITVSIAMRLQERPFREERNRIDEKEKDARQN